MDGNYTLSDIAAVTGGNRNNDGGFGGGDWGAWIILFLLFGLFGRGGYGGFGGGSGGGDSGGAGFQGYATRADINAGFALNNLQTGINAIQQGICDSAYALTNAINGGFHGVDRGLWQVSSEIADCCCKTQRAIDGVNFNMAQNTCALQNTMNMNTRDLLENQNSNTRAILDFLTKDKIDTLTAENQALRFRASQTEQNAFITANQQAQTAELIRRLGADCPTPAYVVQPPTPVNFPVNGCGTVQFGNYGWNNGGCGCGCG